MAKHPSLMQQRVCLEYAIWSVTSPLGKLTELKTSEKETF
jgi:hypothetical protein